ncbi:MAG: S9 family peptidase, partial [Bacteroidota bacterium]
MRKIGNYLLMVLAIAGMTACDNSTGKDDSGEQTDIPVVPLEDFFRNPEKSGYQISPDGTYLSYLAPYES